MGATNATADDQQELMRAAARAMGQKSWALRLQRCGGIEGVRAEARAWALARVNKSKKTSGDQNRKG